MKLSVFAKDGTAQGVAKQRLIETLARQDKRIISDPYAARFVMGASVIKMMGHKLNTWLSEKLLPGFHEHIIARTRFIDDLVEKTVIRGIDQYVILGAGYDLRAHRLKLPSSVKVFEVDQPEVQNKKRSKLSDSALNSNSIVYVAIDFSRQSLARQGIQIYKNHVSGIRRALDIFLQSIRNRKTVFRQWVCSGGDRDSREA